MLLRDDIYSAVRADILTCRLPPGTEMREQDLAERYNVSRAPVRDALLRLERERLVTIHPRQGSRVNPISLADARELFQFRLILEPSCAALAADSSDSEMLSRLDFYRSFEPDGDFIEYNRAFHSAVAAASGNQRMRVAMCDLIDQAERIVRVSVNGIKGRDPALLIAEHSALIDAIQDRNARAASRIVREHILKAERRVIAALERSAILS